MAFGFSPKHLQDYQLENLDKEHFLVYAFEAVEKLNWTIAYVSPTGIIAFTKASMSSWSEEVTIKIDNGVVNLKSVCTGSQIYDWGKNKKNITNLLSAIENVKNTLTPDEIEAKLLELQEKYATDAEDVLGTVSPLSSMDKISDIFSIFKPTKGYFISPILININLLIFIIMLISGVDVLMPENEDLLNWGASFKPLILEGEWWRLLTSCFIHIGVLHVLLNMYALLYIGILLEPYLGKARFLAAYLITGIAASLISLWWNDFIISAGASGAIFGMYGVFLALLTTNLLDKSIKKDLMTSIMIFVVYNLMHGFSKNSGIDNAAHIGGLVSGLIVGYAFIPSLKQFENKKIKFISIGILSLVLLIPSFLMLQSIPNDIGKYDEKMGKFSAMELNALEVYSLPEGTPNDKILAELKDSGIYYWNENIKLLESFKSLDLPAEIQSRNIKLKQYCRLRIKSYELTYKAIEENSNNYENELISYNQQIEAILKELSGE